MLDPGFAIRTIRLSEHLTQRQLAKRAKLGKNTIAYIERRERVPNYSTFVACCRGLGVQPWIVVEIAGAYHFSGLTPKTTNVTRVDL